MGVAQGSRTRVVLRRYVAGVALPLALASVAVWAWTRAPEATAAAAAREGGSPPAAVTTPGTEPRTPGDAQPRPSEPPTSSPTGLGFPTALTPEPSSPSGTGTDAAPDPSPDGGSGVVPAGPGTTVPGVRLSVTPAVDGTLEVSERVLLDSATTRLSLSPPDLSRAGGDFASARPVATAVQLSADGQPVAVGSGTVGAPRTVDLAQPASAFELRYVLTGADVRSVPSTAGRALAAVAPLTRTGTTPVVITTSGDAVRNLTCAGLDGRATVCSDGVAGAMSVRDPLTDARALVVLQLDLPRP